MFQDRWYQEEALAAITNLLGLDNWASRPPHRGVSLIAATGAGKTKMAGDVLAKVPRNASIAVFQHRNDLVNQNRDDMCLVADIPFEDTCIWQGPNAPTGARVVFAMTQTVVSQMHLLKGYDFVVFDEAHHAPADGNAAIIARIKELNPNCRFLFLTACALRVDRRKLSSVGAEVCAYQVSVGTLIEDGTLARPIPKILDLGVAEAVKGRKQIFDFAASDPVVEAILGTKVAKEAIVQTWKTEAYGKRTLGFASSVKQAEAMAKAFTDAGIPSFAVHSKMKDEEVARIKADHRADKFLVLWNVNQLTEGYDDPLIECIINLRNMAFEITALQVWGRGLRKPNPARYPGIVKDTCLLLDFGASLARMPDIFTAPLPTDSETKRKGPAPTKDCPECGHKCHLSVRECPDCGAAFPVNLKLGTRILAEVKMMDLADLKKKSKLPWKQLTPTVVVASTFDGVAIAWRPFDDKPFRGWYVDGAGVATFLLEGTMDQVCSALDAYVRDSQGKIKWSASKGATWQRRPASPAQMGYVRRLGGPGFEMTGGEASAWIAFLKNKPKLLR